MDCSDGAKMLIDQMKEHPEEFRGYAGKFASLLDTASNALQGTLRNTCMSKRDAAAILTAAETHLYEVWLAEDVLTRIMQPKPEVETERAYTVGRGKSVLGQVIQSSGYATINNSANTASNTLTSHYDQTYQMEMAKYKAEIARQLQNEDALRNTKPFTKYL